MRTTPIIAMLLCVAFSVAVPSVRAENRSTKDAVKRALEQADLKDVTVDEDRDKNTITLKGKVHSEDAKARAEKVAESAAGSRIVANEISVKPVGAESEARHAESDTDAAIEKNYHAALLKSRLDKQRITGKANNGVLTLTGTVDTPGQRAEAEKLAKHTPNVKQVVNELDVKHNGKGH